MGAVWEGWDERLRRPVALKILHAPQGAGTEPPELVARRAMREARLAARLHHRHAVTIYDVVEHEGQPCLVLELVPSQPLSEILSELTTLHEQETATLGAQVASALAAAHAAGIVHRDVKPANILVADDGTARISDFGIAHAIGDSTVTSTGMLTGTPAYLAPEVARGAESGYASDVFSLGSTLYATLEGRPPFGQAANQIGLLHRVAEGHVEPPQHAGALTPLLRQMLSTDIGARPTMAEVADRLHRLSTDPEAPLLAGVQTTAVDGVVVDDSATGSSGGVRVGPPISSSTSRRRRRVLGLVALLLLAALVVAGFVLLRPGAGNDSAAPPGVQDSPSASSTTSEVTGTATASRPGADPRRLPVGRCAVTDGGAIDGGAAGVRGADRTRGRQRHCAAHGRRGRIARRRRYPDRCPAGRRDLALLRPDPRQPGRGVRAVDDRLPDPGRRGTPGVPRVLGRLLEGDRDRGGGVAALDGDRAHHLHDQGRCGDPRAHDVRPGQRRGRPQDRPVDGDQPVVTTGSANSRHTRVP